MWFDELEPGAEEQARNLARLPFAFKHIAIMPDAHKGYGMPIGGVLATQDAIVPNAVGSDIECGCTAVKTTLTEKDTELLKQIVNEIGKLIPMGFDRNRKPYYWKGFDHAPDFLIIQSEIGPARFGSIGIRVVATG